MEDPSCVKIKEEVVEDEEVERTCEVCNVTLTKEEYVNHVLKEHVSDFDVGLCQVERCYPCISKNDGLIIRRHPDGENQLDVDYEDSDVESLEGDKLIEILNKDYEDADAHLFLYAKPGEKLHDDIKYKKISTDDPKPFTLVKPMAPIFKEVPSWPKPEPSAPVTVQQKLVSIQTKQLASIQGLTPAQRAMIPQIISRLTARPNPHSTYQKRPIPEVIDL